MFQFQNSWAAFNSGQTLPSAKFILLNGAFHHFCVELTDNMVDKGSAERQKPKRMSICQHNQQLKGEPVAKLGFISKRLCSESLTTRISRHSRVIVVKNDFPQTALENICCSCQDECSPQTCL